MRDHGDAVEADLLRFYGVDLGDLWRGGLSFRRLAVLVAHLPMGSAVWAIQADIPYGWTLTDVLIADVFHALTGEPHPLRVKFGARAQQARHAELFARLRAQKERAVPPS